MTIDELVQFLRQGGGHGFYRTVQTQHHIQPTVRHLPHRPVGLEGCIGLLKTRGKLQVVHHTHDRLPAWIRRIAAAQALPNRALPRPEATDHRFVDDHDSRSVRGVAGVKESSFPKPHAHRLEESGAHGLVKGQGQRSEDLAFDPEITAPEPPKRQH